MIRASFDRSRSEGDASRGKRRDDHRGVPTRFRHNGRTLVIRVDDAGEDLALSQGRERLKDTRAGAVQTPIEAVEEVGPRWPLRAVPSLGRWARVRDLRLGHLTAKHEQDTLE